MKLWLRRSTLLKAHSLGASAPECRPGVEACSRQGGCGAAPATVLPLHTSAHCHSSPPPSLSRPRCGDKASLGMLHYDDPRDEDGAGRRRAQGQRAGRARGAGCFAVSPADLGAVTFYRACWPRDACRPTAGRHCTRLAACCSTNLANAAHEGKASSFVLVCAVLCFPPTTSCISEHIPRYHKATMVGTQPAEGGEEVPSIPTHRFAKFNPCVEGC